MTRPGRTNRAAYALALSLSAACAAQPTLDPSVVPREANARDDVTALPGWLAAARGFDALVGMPSPDAIQPGDRLLYRIRHRVGNVENELYLGVRLGQPDGTDHTEPARLDWRGERRSFPVSSPNRRCEIVVYDVASATETATQLLVPEVSMHENLYSAAAVYGTLDPAQSASDADLRKLAVGVKSVGTLLRLWQENDALRDLLERVVGRPSALAMLRAALTFDFSYSVAVELTAAEEQPVDLPHPIGTLDGSLVPMAIAAAGQSLLLVDVHFVECAAPLSVGMGLISFRGVHPTDPERWIAVDLVGARRASRSEKE